MNELEERKYYEEEDDEIDLMELIRTLMKHKALIIVTTLVITAITLVGGYTYNKIKTVNSVIIGFNYPEIEVGKNPDNSIFIKENIIPLNVLNKVFTENKKDLKYQNLSEFRAEFKVEGIIPQGTEARIEQAIKSGQNFNYTPTQYKISTKDDIDILNKVVNGTIEEFITKYRPNYTIVEFGKLDGYDYDNIYSLLNDRIAILKANISIPEKRNYISNRTGHSFEEVSIKLDSLINVELQDYYSYFIVNNVSLNKIMRETRYDSDIKRMTLEKEKLEAKAEVIKNMLDSYKPTEKKLIVPTVGEFGVKIDTENEYYTSLINKYLAINNEIKDKDFTIKELKSEKAKVNYPSETQKKVLEQKLQVITDKFNAIVKEVNTINEEYINARYYDMIKIVSPAVETSTGKPLVLFLGVGVILGGMLGIFLAFVKEFVKNYRKKYSK